MEQDIVAGNLGTVGKYDVAFKDGSLVGEMDASLALGSVGLVIKFDAGAVLDALKAAIPGHFDDVLIDGAKALLLGK